MLIFNELDSRGFASAGWDINVPNLLNASEGVTNKFSQQINLFLLGIKEGFRAQVRWAVNSDYKQDLLDYKKVTDSKNCHPWTRQTRDWHFEKAWNAMQSNQLRRESCQIFLSKQIPSSPSILKDMSSKGRIQQRRDIVAQLRSEFDHQSMIVQSAFNPVHAKVSPLSNLDLFRLYFNFLNPSARNRLDFSPDDLFDPLKSIHQNCFHSAFNGGPKGWDVFKNTVFSDPEAFQRNPFGFALDGHLYSILTLSRVPRRVFPQIIHALTQLPFLDYEIVVNIEPVDIDFEIKKEENLIRRIEGDMNDPNNPKPSLQYDIDRKNDKIGRLRAGFMRPFKSEFLILIKETSIESLLSKKNAIQLAIHSMNQALYNDPNLSSTTLNLWTNAWPGWSFGSYPWRSLYTESDWLADLLPISSTFVGHLKNAEAIYFGDNKNLVGVRNFISDTPQHSVMLGKSRGGKSALEVDRLSQTDCYYDYTVLIEEGLSYANYTSTMGFQPIIVHPDGLQTINYFDTLGLPLTSMQLAVNTSLVAQMVGRSSDEDKQATRQAQIGQYIEQLYTDGYREWLNTHESLLPEIARTALSVNHILKADGIGGSFMDAFTEFRDRKKSNDDEMLSLFNNWNEEQISRFLKNPDSEKFVRNVAYSFFEPHHYPQHSQLYEMMLYAPFQEHNREKVNDLASRLLLWCKGHNYGCFFDGETNTPLNGRVTHFELGQIPDALMQMKVATGFLLLNQVRQIILSLPRGSWKRMIFEEIAKYMEVPGGASQVKENYMQMGKYRCHNQSIVQQYANFKNSPIRPYIFGNSTQFFFLKQDDLNDVADMSSGIGLPEVTQQAILNYPMPQHMEESSRCSFATYFHQDANQPLCGTIANFCSPEMLECSSSNTEGFKANRKKTSNPVPLHA